MKKEYTTAIHVARLKKMLNRKDPCGLCPASIHFDSTRSPGEMWKDASEAENSCEICQSFLEISGCPCMALGKSEALKLTYLAIEKYEDEKENL